MDGSTSGRLADSAKDDSDVDDGIHFDTSFGGGSSGHNQGQPDLEVDPLVLDSIELLNVLYFGRHEEYTHRDDIIIDLPPSEYFELRAVLLRRLTEEDTIQVMEKFASRCDSLLTLVDRFLRQFLFMTDFTVLDRLCEEKNSTDKWVAAIQVRKAGAPLSDRTFLFHTKPTARKATARRLVIYRTAEHLFPRALEIYKKNGRPDGLDPFPSAKSVRWVQEKPLPESNQSPTDADMGKRTPLCAPSPPPPPDVESELRNKLSILANEIPYIKIAYEKSTTGGFDTDDAPLKWIVHVLDKDNSMIVASVDGCGKDYASAFCLAATRAMELLLEVKARLLSTNNAAASSVIGEKTTPAASSAEPDNEDHQLAAVASTIPFIKVTIEPTSSSSEATPSGQGCVFSWRVTVRDSSTNGAVAWVDGRGTSSQAARSQAICRAVERLTEVQSALSGLSDRGAILTC